MQTQYVNIVASGLVLLSALLNNPLGSQEPVSEKPSIVPLQVGDLAPELKVDQWIKGPQVSGYDKDKIYVIEFWATWCGPCIKSMPHLHELATRYSKDGLVVVAITKADDANTLEAVERFTKETGARFDFRYAFCSDDTTHKSFMEAAGKTGIPCSFVIDQSGKIAYIGLPSDLDYVLERVVEGKWRGKADADELQEMNASISKLGQLAQSDPEKALQIIAHVERVNPQRTKSLDFAYSKTVTLCAVKRFDEAKDLIESMSVEMQKSADWGLLSLLAAVLASKETNPASIHREYAISKIQQCEMEVKNDWQNLMQVAMAYRLAGEKAKYRSCMEQVIADCTDSRIKQTLKAALAAIEQLPDR